MVFWSTVCAITLNTYSTGTYFTLILFPLFVVCQNKMQVDLEEQKHSGDVGDKKSEAEEMEVNTFYVLTVTCVTWLYVAFILKTAAHTNSIVTPCVISVWKGQCPGTIYSGFLTSSEIQLQPRAIVYYSYRKQFPFWTNKVKSSLTCCLT